MGAVGKTPNRFKFIRISSHTPKNIQEGIADIICEDIDILSHPKMAGWKEGRSASRHARSQSGGKKSILAGR